MSLLEAVFARGDRKLGKVIYKAWESGCSLDAWNEYFDFAKWEKAFDECGVDAAFYANRRRDYNEELPWEHIDMMISREFLIRENKRALEGLTTGNCGEKCAGCGIDNCEYRRNL
jgi:hypothetical protein